MDIKTIKKLIRTEHELIKNLMLTNYQLNVIEFVESCEEVTSGDVKKRFNVSIQSASAVLSRLAVNGWLARDSRTDPSGGIVWVYSVM